MDDVDVDVDVEEVVEEKATAGALCAGPETGDVVIGDEARGRSKDEP